MIDSVFVVESREWFDVHIKRREEKWREGMTVGDLFPGSDHGAMAFVIGGRRARVDDQVGPGDWVMGVASPEGEAIVGYLIQVLIAAAVGFVVNLLIGPPKAPKAIGDEGKPSESFVFGGTRTLYNGTGVPLPLIYGERAVGGVVVGQSVLATGSPQPQQILNLLLALGTGPVESIGGITVDSDSLTGSAIPDDILINENPASSYSGIEISIRLGDPDQTPLSGAPIVAIESQVDLPITNNHADDNLPAVTDWSNAVVYTMPEGGDGVQLNINFTSGLYSSVGGGAGAQQVDFEVRYRRVDDFGVPFGDYWPGGPSDPAQGLSFSIQRSLFSPFAESIYFNLFDPSQTILQEADNALTLLADDVPPTSLPSGTEQPIPLNKAYDPALWLDSDGDATYANEDSVVESYSVEVFADLKNDVLPPYFNTDGSITPGVAGSVNYLSESLVHITDLDYKYRPAPLAPQLEARVPNIDWNGAAAFRGLSLFAGYGNSNGKASGWYRQIGLNWGDGVGVGKGVGWDGFLAPIQYPDPIEFNVSSGTGPIHIVATFERDFDGNGNNRARIYLDGTLTATKVSTVDFKWPANADLFEEPAGTKRGPVVINSVQGTQYHPTVIGGGAYRGSNTFDRIVFYGDALTEVDIFNKFGGGIASPPNLLTENVEAWWEMAPSDLVEDQGGATEWRLLDRSGNGHDLILYDGALTPTKPTAGFSFGDGLNNGIGFSGFPLNGRYEVSIQRTNLVADSDTISDKATLGSVAIFTTQDYSFPGVAMMSVRLPAQDQLTSLQPNFSIPVKGLRVPVWDGVSETNPTFNRVWSNNNAWVALDILTSPDTGLGCLHDLQTSPIIAKWKAWADNCDELADDQEPAHDVYPATYTGTIRLTPAAPFGGSLVITRPTSGWKIPASWRVGDWVLVEGMPVAQTLLGYPNNQLMQIVQIYSANGSDDIWLHWPSSGIPAPYPPSTFAFQYIAAGTLTLNRYEPRSQADYVIDGENQSAWEALQEVCTGGRAAPVRIGDQVSIAFQGIRSPVQMFSDANIIPGSVTISSVAADELFNAVNYTFFNRQKQWRRDSVPLDHSDLREGTGVLRISRSFSSSTITRTSQILRESRYQLNLNKVTRQWIEFDAMREAARVEPGDVFLFSGSLPQYGFAGRMPAQVDIGATSIAFDVEVTLDPEEFYSLAVQTQDGSISTFGIASPGGVYPAGTSFLIGPPVADTILEDANWAIGSLSTVTREFQVVSMQIGDGLTVRIKGAEYDPSVFDETAFAELPESTGSELYDPSGGDGFPPALASLSVEEVAGPSTFGGGGAGIRVSIQHARTSPLLGTTNQAIGGEVKITAKEVGTSLAPVNLGSIPAGSNSAVLPLPSGLSAPGVHIEVSAAPSSPVGAAQAASRARKARVRVSGLSAMPEAPGGLTASLTGSSAIYEVTLPRAGYRARPVRAEIRAGGWLLGQHIATVVPGEPTRPTDAWLALPLSSAGRRAAPLYVRCEYSNGQWSDVFKSTSFAPDAPGTGLKSDSFEDGPWDAVTGDSGTVALSEMETETQGNGDEILRFTDASTATTGTWTSPEYDLGSSQESAVFFAIEGAQVHAGLNGSAAPTSREVADWSIEGPLSNFPGSAGDEASDCAVTLQIAFSDTATPGTSWQEYRPGIYSARSFAFRISVTRPDLSYNVDIWRGAFAITEPAQIVSHAGSF